MRDATERRKGRERNSCHPVVAALCVTVLVGLLVGYECAGAADLELAAQSEARAAIVAPPGVGQPARFAAEELKLYLDRITGACFTIQETMPESGAAILVGDSEESRRRGIAVDKLKRDGFVIWRAGNTLVIAGRDDKEFAVRKFAELESHPSYHDGGWRLGWKIDCLPECATVFGVYAFLEGLGVRWFFPGPEGEHVPRRRTLHAGGPAGTVEPAWIAGYATRATRLSAGDWSFVDYEQMGVDDRAATYWILRMRRSTMKIPMGHMPLSHRFVQRFGEAHPEYFALREDGTRENVATGGSPSTYGHLCYSSPVVDEAVKDVRAFFCGRPAAERGLEAWRTGYIAYGDYFSIHTHDALRKGCHCDACREKWSTEGDPSGLLSELIWGYVARVGREIQETHPDKRVVCFAYNTYRQPPKTVSLPSNVLAGCTAIVRAPGTPAAQRQIDEVRSWRLTTGQKVYVADYYNLQECCYRDALVGIPQTEARGMAAFFRAVKDDIVGVMHENVCTHGFQKHVDSYLFYRLRWDPCLDADQTIKEYCRLFYGPAAGEIDRVLRCAEDHWLDRITQPTKGWGAAAYRDIRVVSAPVIWSEIYNEEEMGRLRGWLDGAATKAAGTPYAERVAFFRKWFFGPLEARFNEHQELKALWATMRPLYVDRFAVAPVIDGKPDDAVWSDAATACVGEMVTASQGGEPWAPEQKTCVQMGYDDHHVYVLIVCEETLIDGLRAAHRSRDDWDVCEDDSVEIFLDHRGTRKRYQHLAVNSLGCVADRSVHPGGADTSYNVPCRIKTWIDKHPEQGKWCVELAFPYRGYVVHDRWPARGVTWVANFTRTRRAHGGKAQLSTWSPHVQGAFNQPDKFGVVEFRGPTRK